MENNANTAPKVQPIGINPRHVLLLIAIAFVLCLMLVYLLNQGTNEEVSSNYLTFGEVAAKLQNDGYELIEGRYLNVNEMYSETITSYVIMKVVGDKDFMYRGGVNAPNEIIVKGNEIVDFGKEKPPYTFYVRGLHNNTRVALFFKRSKGIDISGDSTNGTIDDNKGSIGIFFFVIVIILGLTCAVWEVVLIYKVFSNKTEPPPIKKDDGKPGVYQDEDGNEMFRNKKGKIYPVQDVKKQKTWVF